MDSGASPTVRSPHRAPVPDENNGVTIANVAQHFHVNLGDQRAGGVDFDEASFLGPARTSGEIPWAL